VWAFIRDLDKKKDDRNAVLACIKQFKGTTNKAVLKARAYEEISRARYAREGKRGSFNPFVANHQNVHATLFERGEPVPECKKVTDFLAEFGVVLGQVAGVEHAKMPCTKKNKVGGKNNHSKFNAVKFHQYRMVGF
jgi:hypothetical protein